MHRALLSVMLMFSKPHTNACTACECMFIELMTVIVITWHMACGVKSVYWCGNESADYERLCVKQDRSYTISCSVDMEDWGHKNKVLLFYMYSSAEFHCSVHLYSYCMYTVLWVPLAHFVISSLTLCDLTLHLVIVHKHMPDKGWTGSYWQAI